jgi:hypothetical protein
MPLNDVAFWSERLRQVLAGYEEPLLRQVAGKLIRPRSQWPTEELVMRCIQAGANPAGLDRRLKTLEAGGQHLLAAIGHSRQPRWPVGSLVELATALGHRDGLAAVLTLLQAGLLFPDLGSGRRCKSFESWLAATPGPQLAVFAHPAVAARALGADLGLPDLSMKLIGKKAPAAVLEADGLEWPLRLAVLWQQVRAGPLRRTQQGDFFKRDLDRLRTDPLLGGAPSDGLTDLPDAGLLTVALGLAEGILTEKDGEVFAAALPAAWDEGLPVALASLTAALPLLSSWNAGDGWQPSPRGGNPYPAAHLLALLLLVRLPEGRWARADDLADWIVGHHPFWEKAPGVQSRDLPSHSFSRTAIHRFLIGLAFQLRLLQAGRDEENGWLVRLSPLGRWVLGLDKAPELPTFPQTLLVQPNLEILAYRQGLTPKLIARLGRFAAWKGLGPACTLQLKPETVYAGLQSGESFETICEVLQAHGNREVPAPVVQLLQTWASKRQRISIYASATLFEFATPADLDEALARGLPAVRLTERVAAVANEADVDFRHFRLTATRDYTLPSEKCVSIEPDGVTLSIDLSRADLLLESEAARFAEPVERFGTNGRCHYRLTPGSTAAGRANGLTLLALESWFRQRSGQPLSPAARLLLTASEQGPLELRRRLVLHVASAEIADGLLQWPGTRTLIEARLGPTALAVAEEHISLLQDRLDTLGIKVQLDEQDERPASAG